MVATVSGYSKQQSAVTLVLCLSLLVLDIVCFEANSYICHL